MSGNKHNTKPERKVKMRTNNEKYRENGGYNKWLNNNKDKSRQYNESKLMNRTHFISDEEWEQCKKFFNSSCAYCGLHVDSHYRKYKGKLQKIDLHKEHVEHKGKNDITNCIPSCINCNSQKWIFSLDDWYNENNINYTSDRRNIIKQWLEQF